SPVLFWQERPGLGGRPIRLYKFRDGDGAGLAEAILELAGNPELAAEQGRRARRLFETKYEFAHAVAAWERLIQKVSVRDF
ncbi:MAG TPA: hypothetical protein VNR65_11815, partial [Geobacterales bacterium]|nr:hypothetical protein [Geobacterales bacterium]